MARLLTPPLLLLVAALGPIYAKTDAPCSRMAYRDQNQIDTRIKVRANLSGRVIDDQDVSVPDVCVGVFSEPDHRLLESTRTGRDGTFTLPGIKHGIYRLTAEYAGLGVANSVIIVGFHGHKKLTIRMRPRRIDTTSSVEGSAPR